MMMSNEYLDTMRAFFKNRPRLNDWQHQKADEAKQSEAYYQAHPLTPQDQVRINQKIERILDATTVLDQASEQAAQSTEMAVTSVLGLTTMPVQLGLSFGSLALGELVSRRTKNPLVGLANYFAILGAGLIPTFAIEGFSAIWGAQQETRASRIARRETRQAELANPNRYALFTEEQQRMAVEKVAQISNEAIEAEEKARDAKTDGLGGAFHQLKTLATDKKSHERDDLLNEVDERLSKPPQAFSQRSEKDLKEDAALVSNITRTINDRSESYTENIENAYSTLASGFSFVVAPLLTFGVSSLIKKTIGQDIGWAGKAGVFLLLEIPLLMFGTRLERDGAKVARWKARQDMKNNPNSLLAVPDQAKASVQGIKDEHFKPKGLWDSFKQAFTLPFEFAKDQKAYHAWEKTEGMEEKKRRKALDQIQLSPEQMEEAKRLQARTNEAFTLTDEYSQESEMMEASTDTLKEIVREIPTFALMAPAVAVIAGHYVPLPKVKWLEKTAKDLGVQRTASNGKTWEPLLSHWRLETIEKSLKSEEFREKATRKLTNLATKLNTLLEEKPFLKPLKKYLDNVNQDLSKLNVKMQSLPPEQAKNVRKWLKEASNYKTLRNTAIGVGATTAVSGLAVLLGPGLLLNSLFTRWQKDSMRVGLMQADDAMKHPNFFKLDGEEDPNQDAKPSFV